MKAASSSWWRILRPRHQPMRPEKWTGLDWTASVSDHERFGLWVKGASFNSLPGMNCIFERYSKFTLGLQIHSDASTEESVSTECAADCTSEATCKTEALLDVKANSEISVSHNVSNLKVSTRHDLALVFTCKVCETRSMKMCSRDSYDKGVVVVRCGGCNNLHLIADRLGWFGEPGSIEELLAARGDVVKKGPIDSLNLTLEDLAGKNP